MNESTDLMTSGFTTDHVYRGRLLSSRASTLDEYIAQGGGDALQIALEVPREDIVQMVKRSGLRGRGGAGFPTGVKWESLRTDPQSPKYLCCNGAEGEPGTFKDRFILRTNPYLLLEGMAIGAYASGADAAFIAVKGRFKREIANLERAHAEMLERGMLGGIPIETKYGPDEYLFGEERALLEVIEGREPMPRILPPYMHGLLAGPTHPYPTIVNNVETMSNIPGIVRHGPDWFREEGTEKSPGTMIFTLVGDVQRPGIYELPLGTPLNDLLWEYGGGPLEGRSFKAVLSGASNPVMVPPHFATPMDFDAMADIGTGLGSGGFIVYDDTACMVKVAATYSRFLHVESCAQCIPCKLHSENITNLLQQVDTGQGTEDHLERILRSCRMVTDGQRCYLSTAESLVVQSIVRVFVGEFAAHLEIGCPLPRPIVLPKLTEFDEDTGVFTFDPTYVRKRPNWTYAPEEPSEEVQT
jgi:NADH:ubiquinone oxidoreductase subunit F (NADH-binding)